MTLVCIPSFKLLTVHNKLHSVHLVQTGIRIYDQLKADVQTYLDYLAVLIETSEDSWNGMFPGWMMLFQASTQSTKGRSGRLQFEV